MQSLLVEGVDRALAGIDDQDMVQLLDADIAADEQPAGSHAKVVVSHTVEDFAFVGADKGHDFVQAQGKYLHMDLVGSLD